MTDVVALNGIHKHFGGLKALEGVDFTLRKGEIHALLGENGAGKSTLIRVLGGEHIPTHGEIAIDGETVHFSRPQDAIEKGITIIHQEMALAGDLTVAENIFLSELPGPSGNFGTNTACPCTRKSAVVSLSDTDGICCSAESSGSSRVSSSSNASRSRSG